MLVIRRTCNCSLRNTHHVVTTLYLQYCAVENFKVPAACMDYPPSPAPAFPVGRRIWRALKCNYGLVRRPTKTGKESGSWRRAAMGRMEDRWAGRHIRRLARPTIFYDRLVRPCGPQRPRVGRLKKTGPEAASRGPMIGATWSHQGRRARARRSAAVVAVFLWRRTRLLRCHTW